MMFEKTITLLLHFSLATPGVDKPRASNRNNHGFNQTCMKTIHKLTDKLHRNGRRGLSFLPPLPMFDHQLCSCNCFPYGAA